ncbi:hypothetical protein [Devosia sp. Naph2]|uniref:hypothetical protein n=1 Tax=Devosia polycyclovorans TaxID=3345148 RepID=UPI0035D0E977
MGNARNWTREFNARQRELAAFVKAKAGRSEKARKEAIKAAASGRPANLPEIARSELVKWRRNREVQKAIDSIAGRTA